MGEPLLPVDSEGYRYDAVVGIGGIGTGMIFDLIGNETLGRNESRFAALSPDKDYCKLHIILHSISVLAGPASGGPIRSYALGRVGDDPAGRELREDMVSVGIDCDRVIATPGSPTLFAVTYQYPDGSAGNITTSSSACAEVDGTEESGLFEMLARSGKRAVAIAAPEVPMQARRVVLANAKAGSAFTIASFVTAEVEEFARAEVMGNVDLLVVNSDEARALAGVGADVELDSAVIERCFGRVRAVSEKTAVIVTDGPAGSYARREGEVVHVPAIPIEARTTAGAGDAYLGGIVVGLCCGLPLVPPRETLDGSAASSCLHLATCVGGFAATSGGAINRRLSPRNLRTFVAEHGIPLTGTFQHVLGVRSPRSDTAAS